MKIKSKIDVITNSSSEVFILKTKDLEEAKKDIYNDETKIYLDRFVDIKSIEDLLKLYEEYPGYQIFKYLPMWIFRKYEISEYDKTLLKKFGHTDKEIKSFEDRENQKRKNLQSDAKILNEVIGYSTAEIYDFGFWGSKNELVAWLKEHNKTGYRYERP